MRELYTPMFLAANSVTEISGVVPQVGGFLATTSGTITVVNCRGETVVSAVPVTAGLYTPMPFSLRNGEDLPCTRHTVTLAGGASGTLGY